MQEQRDEKLWQIAKRRASFQDSLIGFIVISCICWAVWYFTAVRRRTNTNMPFPPWVMFGLGIGLVMKFTRAYKTDSDTLAEQKCEKLKNQNK